MTDLIKTPENHFYLSPEEVEQFHRQGYIGPFTLYSPDEMKILWRKTRLQALDRSHAAYQSTAAVSGNTNISNYDRHLDIDFLAEHICRREIVDRVSSILGPDVICWRTEFFLNILVKKVLTGIKPTPSPMRPVHRKSFGPRIQNSEERLLSGVPSPKRQPITGASSSSPALTRLCSMTKPSECITAMSKPTR